MSEDTVFEQALARPVAEREAFLRTACGDDAALRARIEALLHAHDEANSFLREPLATRALPASPPEEKPSDVIGRYKLLEKIGEGGCGVVWMAEQSEPVRRRVALKVIKLGMDTREVIARFEAERQALALMDHPNIAKVFDGGATGGMGLPTHDSEPRAGRPVPHLAGRPFFVMELVRGLPITRYCDEAKLTPTQRLELFIAVCSAVQHAHQKGIVHRDLKPSNILVTVNDGVATPKVIDFGIAKATQGPLTDKTLFTAFQQFIGTPTYMSPEQADLSSVDIDTRSDIYSLGVLLYELLTGAPPFDPKTLLAGGVDEIRRIIREIEPPRPSTRVATLARTRAVGGALRPDAVEASITRGTKPLPQLPAADELRGDLDWIVMRCLEKDRARRYETANALAADLRRHLAHEPIVARPPSIGYRVAKFCRRHRTGLITAAFAALLVLIGTVGAWHLGRRAAPVGDATPAAPDPRSIAVLPFANLNGDADTRFFADGVHEDVLTSLGVIRQLRVISRTSVERYRDSKQPLHEIARELNVAFLLEGSVRRAGATVLVTGKLIRPPGGEQVSAWRLERDMKDVFAIQTTIATEIAGKLSAAIAPAERQVLQRLPTRQPDAYDAYLKARDLENRRGTGPAMLAEQEQLLERAVTLDPDFGLAWARLARVRAFLVFSGAKQAEGRLAGAQDAIDRAGRLIPDAPELPLMRGYVHYFGRHDYARAEQEFQRATAAAPNSPGPRYALAVLHRRQGRWTEAWQALRAVERMDPGNPEYAEELYHLALSGRRYDDAESALRRAEALGRKVPFSQGLLAVLRHGTLDRPALLHETAPGYLRELELMTGGTLEGAARGYRLFEACALAANGDWPAARELAQSIAEQQRGYVTADPAKPGPWARLGVAEALLGHRDEALRCAAKAVELAPESLDPWNGPVYRINLALAKSWTGDLAGAVQDYARLLGVVYYHNWNDEARIVNVFVMRHHAAFFPLRNHPGFIALLTDPKHNAPLF
ncbi:MAG: protein kinase [Verrucomicrobia bacterium]|nr:protein kinase [Verrucomicrobiota bacterium]